MSTIQSESVLTCPVCGVATTELMPLVSCQIVYRCVACGAELWPKPGDCCVYCSYGSVPCQAIQFERSAFQ